MVAALETQIAEQLGTLVRGRLELSVGDLRASARHHIGNLVRLPRRDQAGEAPPKYTNRWIAIGGADVEDRIVLLIGPSDSSFCRRVFKPLDRPF